MNFKIIDLLVLTGGFTKCNLLKEELKNNFNYPYKELIDPEVSIMKGAAIYGIKPNQIVSRKAPYTIGTKVYSTRKEGTECRNRRKGRCEYFDIFNTVILEKEPYFKPQAKGVYDINILSFNENAIDFEINTTEPAIILYADNYTKDWRAYNIDNPKQKYEIICADYIYKSISVDKGYHKIRFEYKPISFIAGKWISIISWIIFIFFWILSHIRKRKIPIHRIS